MKRIRPALLALPFILLAACDSGENSVGQAVKDEFGKNLRREFIAAFSEQCTAQMPENQVLQAAAKQVCDCAANKAADNVSAADLTALASGNKQELQNKYAGIMKQCAEEQFLPAKASGAASDGQ